MTTTALIRSSLILSGILGIKLEGLPNGHGGFTTLETTIPLNIAYTNQTALSTIRSENRSVRRGQGNLNFPLENHISNLSNRKKFPTTSSKNEIVNNFPQSKGYRYPKPSVVFVTPEPETQKEPPQIQSISSSSCDLQSCLKKNATCVTWVKEVNDDSTNKSKSLSAQQHQNKMIFSECLPDDDIGFPKINPKLAALCPEGKTHSIQLEPQPCLQIDPPCQLIWKYHCVKEEVSPHNCTLKKCPSSGCVEQISCGEHPPCIVNAICLPSFLIP